MNDENLNFIVGLHSIADAISNTSRAYKKIICTKDGLSNLKNQNYFDSNQLEAVEVQILKTHHFQEECKKYYKKLGFEYKRVTGGIALICSSLEIGHVGNVYDEIENSKRSLKIVCLDQVTDTQNAAAILRTCSFFGVDFIVLGRKGNFGLSPSFFRTASGATEHVKIITTGNLSRFLSKVQEKNVKCFGLSEHATENLEKGHSESHSCLVFGSEDKGISHAVSKVLKSIFSISSQGKTNSLNVSVAVAVSLEKFFGQ